MLDHEAVEGEFFAVVVCLCFFFKENVKLLQNVLNCMVFLYHFTLP